MNNDSKRLLDEVLGEAAPAEFRAALMTETLRRVRRRRRMRTVNQGFLLALCLIGLPILAWRAFVFGPPSPRRAPVEARHFERPSFQVVHSRPLSPTLIVQTKPGVANVVASLPTGVAVVETNPDERLFRQLTDEELLGLLAGKPAALVRPAPNQAELYFLNPEDQNGFQVQ